MTQASKQVEINELKALEIVAECEPLDPEVSVKLCYLIEDALSNSQKELLAKIKVWIAGNTRTMAHIEGVKRVETKWLSVDDLLHHLTTLEETTKEALSTEK